MPPVSPNTSVLFNTLNEKKNMLTESQIFDEKNKRVINFQIEIEIKQNKIKFY
jgi:hypothetical protein